MHETRDGFSVTTRQLSTEERVLAICRRDPLAGADRVQWEFLPVRPLVVNTVSGTTTADCLPQDGQQRNVITCRNFDEWLELVAAGDGIGVVPELAARRINHPDVAFVPIAGAPRTPLRLAWREQPAPVRAVRAFLEAAFTRPRDSAADPPRRATL